MMQVVNDGTYQNAAKRKQFSAAVQTRIDSLVKQCTMKGAEHEALHVWLEKVLIEVKERRKKDDACSEVSLASKRDVGSFYDHFQ